MLPFDPTCYIGSTEKMFWGKKLMWSPGGFPGMHVCKEMHIHSATDISLCKHSQDLQQIQCKKKMRFNISKREDGFPVETTSS